jgi:glycine cleavage system H protein
LGDVVYVDIKVGRVVKAGEELGDLESVKATTPIMAPLGGKIIEVNPLVTKDPAIVNTSPEKDGWMAKLEIDDPTATGKLMDEPAYKKFLAKSS